MQSCDVLHWFRCYWLLTWIHASREFFRTQQRSRDKRHHCQHKQHNPDDRCRSWLRFVIFVI
jgi:hypothetical protein